MAHRPHFSNNFLCFVGITEDILDQFDGAHLATRTVLCFDNLAMRALAQEFQYLILVVYHLPGEFIIDSWRIVDGGRLIAPPHFVLIVIFLSSAYTLHLYILCRKLLIN